MEPKNKIRKADQNVWERKPLQCLMYKMGLSVGIYKEFCNLYHFLTLFITLLNDIDIRKLYLGGNQKHHLTPYVD